MEKPRQQMEVNTPRRRRYRFNPKKLVVTLISLGCLAALIALIVQFMGTEQSSAYQGAILPSSEDSQTVDLGGLKGKCIVVDAGHGGADPGTIGPSGVQEDDLNLKVAQFLQDNLESQGAEVIMTRSDDNAIADTKEADMAERRRIIESSGSDIVISIHMNHFEDPSVSGPLVLYMTGSAQGEKLADSIISSIDNVISTDGKTRAEGGLFILKSGNQPCVLVECGYLSNAGEEASLQREDYQKKIANAICEGAAAFFGEANPAQ